MNGDRLASVDESLPSGREAPQAPADATGADRLGRNVLSSWAAHLVFVASGFVMPRMIDEHLGQGLLGVWDFGWSIVGYFGLAQAGIGSSVNRYVAKYRASGHLEELRRTVSSVMALQAAGAVLVLGLTAAAMLLIPAAFAGRLGEHLGEARWVVLLLGMNLAVQMAFNVFVGVITGCHRWDVHNAINGGLYAGTVVLMIAALQLGGGLAWLAAAHLLGTTLAESIRAVMAYRVCPGLKIRRADANWSTLWRQLKFGSKILVPRGADLLLNQTVSLLIVGYLGPAALALYARPLGLVRHVGSFLSKFAFVLTPVASSMQATGQSTQLGHFFVKSSRYGLYVALPMVATVMVLGDQILQVWMGPRYAAGALITVLSFYGLANAINEPIFRVLSGMNRHGIPGAVRLAAACIAVPLVFVSLDRMHWGLFGVALAVVLPLFAAHVLFVPAYACRVLGLSLARYWSGVLFGPVIAILPYVLCLIAARYWFGDEPWLALAVGCGTGWPMLGAIYWRWVIPDRLRGGILDKLRSLYVRVIPARAHLATVQSRRSGGS